MWSYFIKGGFMMYPLLACSILSVAIIIERLLFFHRISSDIRLIKRLFYYLKRKEMEKAQQLCQRFSGVVFNILKSGLSKFTYGKEVIEEGMQEQSLYEIPKLEKYLPFLQALASISTLMGFTGTVIGMIRAFNDIVQYGISSPTVVAKGIAEALITTATGLFIAIPTLLFYHYFSHRVERTMIEIEQYTTELLSFSKER
ncbi:MAG: MotA/TolQ/ExbB proton channel family protein [Elusimicrobiota bacterium]|nr:MotA/TolQ/ExbB proton channel family protein [Elusimicrobiota bacterium]